MISSLIPSSQQERQAVSKLPENLEPLKAQAGEAAKDAADNLREPAQQAVASVKEQAGDSATRSRTRASTPRTRSKVTPRTPRTRSSTAPEPDCPTHRSCATRIAKRM